MENTSFRVNSSAVRYDDQEIVANYTYSSVEVTNNIATAKEEQLVFKTARQVPKTGLLLVGWGGNNGTTVTAGILANKLGLTWQTKEGLMHPNYYGSLTQASTIRVGLDGAGNPAYIPFNAMLPMVHPNDLVLGGWDISAMNMADAMGRACVLDYALQQQLAPHMARLPVPWPSIYDPAFIAGNQSSRADNVLAGSKWQQVEAIQGNIAAFKAQHALDKVIVLWTATTEKYVDILPGVHDSAEHLLAAIRSDCEDVSPSSLFAVASILSDCAFINGSPQNTFLPGVTELALQKGVFLVGNDFKSGQTKIKSVLVDYLISAGIKPVAIVSYNHLGNNDGQNLSAPEQFRSKEITKTNVVDDMVASNDILYGAGQPHPDHCIVIKYVPYVKDSKRAMDEYTSEIFLNGRNTIVMHNTCEDSLLAAPLIIDLAVLCELCQRITVRRADAADEQQQGERMHSVLSVLAYLMKAPEVPQGTPVLNALAAQRQCLVNLFRACVGLPAENFLTLEHKLPMLMAKRSCEGDGGQEASKRLKVM